MIDPYGKYPTLDNRDRIAVEAMKAIIIRNNSLKSLRAMREMARSRGTSISRVGAALAYEYADAMIAESKVPRPEGAIAFSGPGASGGAGDRGRMN